MMWSGFGPMWLFGLLLLVGLVLLVTVAVLALSGGISRGSAAAPPSRSRAREILDERYARGELSTDEYRDRLRVLEEGP